MKISDFIDYLYRFDQDLEVYKCGEIGVTQILKGDLDIERDIQVIDSYDNKKDEYRYIKIKKGLIIY